MITQKEMALLLVRFAGFVLSAFAAFALAWCIVQPPTATGILGTLPAGVDEKVVLDVLRPQLQLAWRYAAGLDVVLLVGGCYCLLGGAAVVKLLCRPATRVGAA